MSESCVWQDRLVKVMDGVVLISRKGDHADFDFVPPKHDLANQAVALACDTPARGVRPDGESLLIDAEGGRYRLTGDDFQTAKLVKERDA